MSMVRKLVTLWLAVGAVYVLGLYAFAQDIGAQTGVNNPSGGGEKTTDAGDLITGTLDDDRLSSNVPLLDAGENIFTGAGLAGLLLSDSTAGTDEKLIRWYSSAGAVGLQLRTDANGPGNDPITIVRSGTDIAAFFLEGGSVLQVNATTLDFNGAADFNQGPTVNAVDICLADGTNCELPTDSGSFTPTWLGFSSAPSDCDVYWRLVAEGVFVWFGGNSCAGTSNAVTFRIDGSSIPAAIKPTDTPKFSPGEQFTVGTDVLTGCVRINNATANGGRWDFGVHRTDEVSNRVTCDTSGWASSGSKGVTTFMSFFYAKT